MKNFSNFTGKGFDGKSIPRYGRFHRAHVRDRVRDHAHDRDDQLHGVPRGVRSAHRGYGRCHYDHACSVRRARDRCHLPRRPCPSM